MFTFMAHEAAFWFQHNARPVTNLNFGGHLGQRNFYLKTDEGLLRGLHYDIEFGDVA